MENIIKFSLICICFIIVLISYWFKFSKRDWVFHMIGMSFTLVSDFFLVLKDNQQMGFFTFCFVHIFYILRVSKAERKSLSTLDFKSAEGGHGYKNVKKNIWYIPVTLVLSIPIYLFVKDLLITTMIIYACLFIQDIIANSVNLKYSDSVLPKGNRIIILTGIILFALCDINVLLRDFLHLPDRIAKLCDSLVWVFYTPSQFLLAFSGVKIKKVH